jgi:hypothetical protein
VTVGTAEGVATGAVATVDGGAVAMAVGGAWLESGSEVGDVGAAAPEQAAMANAATTVVASSRRIESPSWGADGLGAYSLDDSDGRAVGVKFAPTQATSDSSDG